MGLLSNYYYTILTESIISVSGKATLNTNMFSLSGARTVYELRIDGEIVDSYEHGTFSKSGSLFAVLEQNNKKRSIRVDVSPGLFTIKYKLLIDEAEVCLTKISEAELKSLWHKRAIST